MWHRFAVALPIVALAIGGSTACATKKFVRTSVADVNEKVDSLGRSVEGTQERVKASETLPDDTKMKIDQMVQQLKQDPKNIFIEIEGHTDNTGDKTFNEKLGLERAQAVERYLYEQYQIPLHKMNVISYGEEKPVAPNNTRAGRAQNRRVVIKVLA
jgi:outer membrane protein OmpA-like peptidoglycan-associated protein